MSQVLTPDTMAKEIFESLPGRWILRRRMPGIGAMTGTASFRTMRPGVLHYREDGILQQQDGRSLRAYREYFYILDENQIRIAFEVGGDVGGTFHSLCFSVAADSVWPAYAQDTYHCGDDDYAGSYLFLAGGRIQIGMIVRGPRKDYVIQTELQRDESGAT